MPEVTTGSSGQPQNPTTTNTGNGEGQGSQGSPQNPAGGNATGSQGQPQNLNPQDEFRKIRQSGRKEEGRRIAAILTSHGIEASAKNLDEVLTGIITGKIKPKTGASGGNQPEDKSKQGSGQHATAQDDEISKILTTKDQEIAGLRSEQRDFAVRSAITEAVATSGIKWANPNAASDAMASFRATYRFELDDESKNVRILDPKGEVLTVKGHDATVSQAFAAFVEGRPHLKATEKMTTGQNVKSQTGTMKTGNLNESFNDFLRKEAGLA